MTIKLMTGAALLALLAACAPKEVILQGERFPVRADLDASIPVEGKPAPTAPARLGGVRSSAQIASRCPSAGAAGNASSTHEYTAWRSAPP